MSKYSSFYQGAHCIDSLGLYQMMKGLLISNMFYFYFFIDDLYYFGSDSLWEKTLLNKMTMMMLMMLMVLMVMLMMMIAMRIMRIIMMMPILWRWLWMVSIIQISTTFIFELFFWEIKCTMMSSRKRMMIKTLRLL